MEAFEALVGELLPLDGWWVLNSVKLELAAEDRASFGKASMPNPELDLVAYRPSDDRLLVVECKNYLDSTGVTWRELRLEADTGGYRLFTSENRRQFYCDILLRQMRRTGLCTPATRVGVAIAVGKFCSKADERDIRSHFANKSWEVFGPEWVRAKLHQLAKQTWHVNSPVAVAAKLLVRLPTSFLEGS